MPSTSRCGVFCTVAGDDPTFRLSIPCHPLVRAKGKNKVHMMDDSWLDRDHHICEARESEYYLTSVLLSNAFLGVWNHNWFMNIDTPSEPITLPERPCHREDYTLTVTQERRRRFYESLMQLVLLSAGKILMVVARPTGNHPVILDNNHIMSIMLWQPPGKRPSLWHIYQSGFLKLAVWDYGLRSLYRVQAVFEGNIAKIFQKHKIEPFKYAYVQMLATAQTEMARGYGYGEGLLRWQCRKHFATYPDSPGVLLDTTTEPALRVYRRLGFKEIASVAVDTGTDAEGINLSTSNPVYAEKKREASETCRQRVMLLQKDDLIK